jgi:hypothetical protein
MPRAIVVALVLILGLVAAFLIYVEVGGPRQEYEDFMNRRSGVDNPRYFHCAELARIQSRWYDYPKSDMWEQIDKRYKRECPDSGVEVRDDIEWSPDLPPEPPEEP